MREISNFFKMIVFHLFGDEQMVKCTKVYGTALYGFYGWEAEFLFPISTSKEDIKASVNAFTNGFKRPMGFTVDKVSFLYTKTPPDKGMYRQLFCRKTTSYD